MGKYAESNMGKMIVGLEPSGAAELAGAKIGDMIIEVNRMPLAEDADGIMQSASAAYEKGTPLNFTIMRGPQIEHFYLVPPPHKPRPRGLGREAGPNPPECFPHILQQWYHSPSR